MRATGDVPAVNFDTFCGVGMGTVFSCPQRADPVPNKDAPGRDADAESSNYWRLTRNFYVDYFSVVGGNVLVCDGRGQTCH